MVFVFKSKLGKIVSHDCFTDSQHGGNVFVTKTPSKLRFIVINENVFLTGGASRWNGAKAKWTEGPFHFFSERIPMGRAI